MAQKFVLTAELQFRRSADVDRYVADLKRKFSDVNINVKTTGTREAVSEMNNLRNSVRQTRDSTEDLARTFALSFKRFVSFSIATRFVSVFTSRLDGAFRKAREFEAEMIKISQVTGKSVSQLSDLTDEINRLSTDLGVYSGTLAKVSVMLSQAGFTARDTKVALDTLAKTELSPTFDNIIDTTEGAIAIFNQFGKGADALRSQLGSLNKVAGAFAVESGDLVQAVRRVGGVFKSSGGDLNELMALFTSVRQTTRENAESIATALKTIFVRIQRPKTIEYLRQFEIELTDAAGRFIGPLKAIEKIYEVFGNLPQGDLRLIEAGEVLAGFRQIGKFIPLIQQYRITQEALNVAKAGENSLDEDAAKAKEGLANRLSRLNEEFLLLIRNISESKTFKVVTDFFIDTTSAVIKLVDALRPLIPLFTAFAGIKLAKIAGGFSRNFTNELGRARTLAFNQGGPVGGYGNTDTVPAMLTPGEFVINKRAAKTIGANKLHQMNKSPQRLNDGGYVKDLTSNKKTLENYYDTEEDFDLYKKIDVNHIILNKKRDRYRNHAKKIWEEASKKEDLSSANKYIIKKTGGFSQNLGEKELDPKEDSENRLNKIAGALAEKDVNNILKGSEKLVNKAGADFKIKKNHFAEVKTNKYKVSDNEIKAKALLGYGYDKKFLNNQKDEIPKIVIDFYHPQFLNKGGFVVEDGAIGVISAGDYNKSNAIDKSNEVYRFPSTFSSKDGGIRVAPFGMSVYTLSAKQKLLDLAAKKTAESIKELSQSYGVEDSISGQFSKSQDVTSSFAGYLNEGLISLLTGMQRTGGSNSFDFDLFSNESNLSAAQETFPKIFGRDVLPNTKLIDAKLSSEADTFNKIKAKTIDFIKSMGFNSRKSIEENSGALNLLANYGFKYNPDLEDENLGIKNAGKSVTQANIEQAKEWLRTTSYYAEEYTSSGKVRSGSEGFIFPTESSKIGVRHTNELIKEAHDIDIDNRTTVDKALANLKNKDATLAKIREIFKNEKNKLDERFKADLTKFAGDRALKQDVNRSIVGNEYAKSSNGAIGYFDTDLMKYAGVKDAARIRLKLMAKAVSSGIPITEIIGSAGAGKTTLAKQIAKEKGKGLYPIFNEEDLNGLDSIINTDSTVSHGKLKSYLTKLSDKDEVIFLSSTTDKEIAALMQNRYKRDSTGEGLFGRKTGATLEADKSTALSEAIVQQYVKAPTKFISVSGRKEKAPVDYDFLSGEKGRLGAQSVGGFSPPTIGHVEGLTRNILRKGVGQEDYLIRASHANPTSKDEKTIRSAIFGERYGFHLAKIGFGDAGFDNVIKSSGFNPELGFVDSYTGRPKVFDIEFDSDKPRAGKSIVATGGKAQENNYTSVKNAAAHGFDDYDSPRSSNVHSEISGTKVRELIKEGTDKSINLLEDYLTPSVYESILLNRDALKHRSNDIDQIVKTLEAAGLSGPKLKDAVEAEFAKDNKYALKFAGGGVVPGVGNRDTVPAMLTPGEFVLNKQAVSEIGLDTLNKQNKGTKRGKSKGRYYFSSNASQTGPTASGGFGLPGGAIGGLAVIGLLTSTISQLVDQTSGLGKVFNALQTAGVKAATSFYLYGEVGQRLQEFSTSISEAKKNYDQGKKDYKDSTRAGIKQVETNNTRASGIIDKINEKINSKSQIYKNKRIEIKTQLAEKQKQQATNLITDPKLANEISELTKALQENQDAYDKVVKPLKDKISGLEEYKTNNNSVIGIQKNSNEKIGDIDSRDFSKNVDEQISKLTEELSAKQDELAYNRQQLPYYRQQLKFIEKSGDPIRINRAKAKLDSLENPLQTQTEMSNLTNEIKRLEELKTVKSNKKGLYKSAKDYVTSGFYTGEGADRKFNSKKASSLLAGGSQFVSSLISSGGEYFNEKADKQLKKGNFSDARSNLKTGAALSTISDVTSLAGQGAALGSVLGPVGTAAGAVAGALYGVINATDNYTEKMNAIDFKILEESIASFNKSLEQYKSGDISIDQLTNKERTSEEEKSLKNIAGRARFDAQTDKGNWFQKKFDRFNNAAASTLYGEEFALGIQTGSTVEILESAITDRNLSESKRSEIIAQQKDRSQRRLGVLEAIKQDGTLTTEQKSKKAEEYIGAENINRKIVAEKFGFKIKNIDKRIAATKDPKQKAVLESEKALYEARLKTLNVNEDAELAAARSIAITAELIKLENLKQRIQSSGKSTLLSSQQSIDKASGDSDVFKRALQESEFAKEGVGRIDQLKSADTKAIDKLSKLGLEKPALDKVKESSDANIAVSEFLDKVKTGGYSVKDISNETFSTQLSKQFEGKGIKPAISAEMGQIIDDVKQANTGLTLEELAPKLEEALKPLIEKNASIRDEAIKAASENLAEQRKVYGLRIAAEKQYIGEISNIINLRKESEQLVAEFGGKTFTPERNRQLELERYNKSVGPERTLNALSGDALLARGKTLEARATLLKTDRESENPEYQADKERLAADTEAFINAAKANIEIRRKEIEIIKEKNRLENDALKSLANGDIESYFNNLQASAATDALAAGDTSILNQLGPKAIAGAVENLQSMQSAGITDYNGQNVSGLIRAGNLATANSLGNTTLANNIANQNAQISSAESDARKSAEALQSAATSQETIATDTFKSSVELFNQSINELIAGFKNMNQAFVSPEPAINKARGGFIFRPRGTDTVPAMLTPGEFVVRRSAVNKIGVGNLNRLNQGYYNKGGVVGGKSEVYNQAGFEQFGTAVQMFKESVSIFKEAISIGNDVQALSAEISKLRESFMDFANTNMSVQLNPTSVQVNISDLSNSMRQGLSESAQQTIIDRVVEELKRGRY